MTRQQQPDPVSRQLLALLDSVLTPRSALYAAGPLDTGRRYYEALARGNVEESVRAENEAALAAFVSRLRAERHPIPVIDPGPLRVTEWSAREIGQFYLDVVGRYVMEAWFIDGWEYSSGATKEYLHCRSLGIPCFSERGAALAIQEAVALLASAVEEVGRLGVAAPKLTERLAAFRSLLADRPLG
jgi:hypothetical protein